MKQKVAFVIVNWNHKDDTVRCLETLKEVKQKNFEIIVYVIDNGSTNDSAAVIKKNHPWIILIETENNLGFTGGNNIGIRSALDVNADFIWILNNDTLVDKNILSTLKVFKDPKVGIVGSKIYFAPGSEYHKIRYIEKNRGRVLWYAGGVIDWNNMYASHRGVDEVDTGQYDNVEETSFVTGCSMIVKKEVFEKIGLFDEKFFAYLEDLDFCLRAKQAGFTLLYNPQSILWHKNAGSSGVGSKLHQYYMTRNRFIVGMRYASIRTKFALAREAFRIMFLGSPIRRKAVMDTLMGKFGKQLR